MFKRKKAAALNEKARKLQDRGDLDGAIPLYREAAALDTSWATPLYNLGLLFKTMRDWERSLDCNQRATRLDAGNEAAWWNLGIAASALGRWDVARAAWRGYGIVVPDGDGPVDFPCGVCPIRLDPDGNAEVVWARRIDPARAVLASIPFPESGHRWKDVVLNDGEPIGYRKLDGRDVPVFNALARLEPSPFATFVARVAVPPDAAPVAKLTEMAEEAGACAEDWSTSIQVLCKACSEGRPHEEHDVAPPPEDGVHFVALAARDRSHAEGILSAWEAAEDGVRVDSLDDV